ncbi:MAG TPA: glycosyltransferase family 2 protein [Nocardioides sp.]|uniref:glycosyltransferase family 2 protein n=1 Tax=Nocardioides sp. TaxID=35761 RepID=UPI002F3FD947
MSGLHDGSVHSQPGETCARSRHRVSVTIPVYNGAETIRETIESVQRQTLEADEILVFDNASTDGSARIAGEFLPSEAVIVAATNEGAVENFNRCAREATGDYFMWLAADDRIRPGFIDTCVRELEANPDAAACLTGIQFTDSAGSPTRVQTDEPLASPDARTRLRSLLRRRRWTETYCMYRRDRLLQSPMFTPEYGADVLLTWWFLLRGPLAVCTDVLFEYREYPLKSVAETVAATSAALGPDDSLTHWRKRRMWTRLREMTYASDVDPLVGKAARRELLLLSTWPGSVFFILEDVLERWPFIDRALRGLWVRLGSPGQIAPTT